MNHLVQSYRSILHEGGGGREGGAMTGKERSEGGVKGGRRIKGMVRM